MATQLTELIKNCVFCILHQPDTVELLIPSILPKRPWQVVGVGPLKLENSWFVIVADYFARYFEVAKLDKLTSKCVITHMKSIFARHGVPEVVRSDNGTQFSLTVGSVYQKFASEYGLKIFKTHFKMSKDPHLRL